MDFEALLNQVRNGELEQFVLEAQDFPQFYEVWRDYPYQNAIRGIAAQGGSITYVKKEWKRLQKKSKTATIYNIEPGRRCLSYY